MMNEEKEYHYDFVVTGVSDQVAGVLMNMIILYVNAAGGYVGGGFRDVEDEAAAEDE